MQEAERTLMNLAEEHGPRVYRLGLWLTGNAADAEEVLQQTFLKAHPFLSQFPPKIRVDSWLMRVAVSEALLKSRKPQPAQLTASDEITPGEAALQVGEVVPWGEEPTRRYTSSELQTIVHEAIGAIEPALRNVVVLRDVAGFSTAEITRLLNLTTREAKSRLLRGRLKLREHLNRYFKQGEVRT